MNLNIVKLLVSASDQSLPFLAGKGSVFEQKLLRVCCTQPVCRIDSCDKRQNCPVPGLVARTTSPDSDLLKRHQKPGLPFVFTPCAGEKSFSLVLLGSAIPHLFLFLQALDTTPDSTVSPAVSAFDYQGIAVSLQGNPDGGFENLPILASAELIDLARPRFQRCSGVTIDLTTPLRLVKDGHELTRFDPVFFIRSLLRRLSSLSAYYGEGLNADQFRCLAALAGEVKLVRKPAATAPLARGRGITGSYELQGPFEELGPMLTLGALIHLGKGASYGQGAFEISPIS